jgi:hypothetical protein
MKLEIEIPDEMIEAIKQIEDEEDINKAILAAIQFSIDNF